jgi:MFS transporter, BCD family, chlorophyll transporter
VCWAFSCCSQVALILPVDFWTGLGLGALTFGAWGMGFNLASVSYFSLASEISGEQGRSRTTAVMFFIMIIGIIISAAALSAMLREVTPERLQASFSIIALSALAMGLVGLLGLEPRSDRRASSDSVIEKRYRLGEVLREVLANPQVSLFFLYLMFMLAAVLGQDVLLEPFAARAFDMPVSATTRITSIWGTCYLASLAVAGLLEGRVSKIVIARLASWIGVASFALVGLSGLVSSQGLFYSGLVLLGLATGPATVSNLSLMLDMTVPGKVGMFIGAWGSASAFARLLGSLTTAAVRDLARLEPQYAVLGYIIGFWILGFFLLMSLYILGKIDLASFRRRAQTEADLPVVDRAVVAGEL